MAELVRLENANGEAVFVNPEHVAVVGPTQRLGLDRTACYVGLSGGSQLAIRGTAKDIAEALNGEGDRDA